MAALSGRNPKTLLELVIKTFSQNSLVCGTVIFELNNVSSSPARRGEACCHLERRSVLSLSVHSGLLSHLAFSGASKGWQFCWVHLK